MIVSHFDNSVCVGESVTTVPMEPRDYLNWEIVGICTLCDQLGRQVPRMPKNVRTLRGRP